MDRNEGRPGNAPLKTIEAEQVESYVDTLQSLMDFLLRHKTLIGIMASCGAALSAIVAFLLPNMYTASALIMPPSRPQSMSTAVAGQIGALLAGSGSSGGILRDPNQMYIGILGSRAVADRIITRFGLTTLYKTKTMEDARKKLRGRSKFSLGRDSLIRVDVEDRDAQRAASIANAYVEELQTVLNRLAVSDSSQRRLFFEKQLETERDALVRAEENLRRTQQGTGILEVNSQAQVVIETIAQLRAEITMREVELQRLRLGATEENPVVKRLEEELKALRSQLARLERERSRVDGDPLISISKIPEAGLAFLRALREVKYHEAMYEVLSKQFEAARLDEAKESPLIQVVDSAVPPDKKSGPHRTLITLLGTIAGAMVAPIVIKVRGLLRTTRDSTRRHQVSQ